MHCVVHRCSAYMLVGVAISYIDSHALCSSQMLCLYVSGCGYAILSTVIFLQYLQSVYSMYCMSKIRFILYYFLVLFYFHNLFDFGTCKPFFLYFPQHLSLMIFSRHSVRGGTFPIIGGGGTYQI